MDESTFRLVEALGIGGGLFDGPGAVHHRAVRAVGFVYRPVAYLKLVQHGHGP